VKPLDCTTLTLLIILELARLVPSRQVTIDALALIAFARMYSVLPGTLPLLVRDGIGRRSQ
jgi:hypothetical protein